MKKLSLLFQLISLVLFSITSVKALNSNCADLSIKGDEGTILKVDYYKKGSDIVVFKIKIHNSNSKDANFKVNGYLRDANKRDEKMNIGLEETIFVLANKDEFVEISVYKSSVDNLPQPQAVFELKTERGKFIVDYTIGINKGDLK